MEESKTRIVEITEGFDFLGFNIRRYKTGNGEKLLIKPSRDSIKKCKRKITDTVRETYGHNADVVIRKLNPIIRGVANYWKPEVSSRAFSEIDRHIVNVTYRFLAKTHRRKSNKWHGTEVVNMLTTEWKLEDALEVKWEEGREDGLEKGLKQKSIEVAKRLLSASQDIPFVMDITGLTEEEIKQLQLGHN